MLEKIIIMDLYFHSYTVQHSFPYIKTPTFVYNAIYDELTVTTFYALDCVPPDCDEEQLKLFENFGKVSLDFVS